MAKTNIKCIDVSVWQGNIDWAKVKASGITCAVLRAGFGREASQIDKKFEQNYKNAKAAGLKVGAYWYSYAEDLADAKREATACLEVIKGKTFELPVFYDMEESFQTKLGKSTLTQMATAFMQSLLKGGFRVGVYANLNWFNNYLDYKFLYGTYYIWLAQYHTEAQLACDMWQYSSSGSINGISGNVDMNIIYNTEILNILGDVNGDGKVNVKDATLIQKHIAKSDELTKEQLEKADINGDGKVTVKDATALQKKIAGKD